MAIVLLSHFAITENPAGRPFAPFDDDLFWVTDDCNKVRAMPEYQEAIEMIRKML